LLKHQKLIVNVLGIITVLKKILQREYYALIIQDLQEYDSVKIGGILERAEGEEEE